MSPLSKRELTKHMQRFNADKDRGISIALFAELAGISHSHFYDVFIYNKEPLTEMVQRRVSKAYQQWKAGNVKVMKRIDNTRYVDYRKESQPVFMPKMGLQVTSDGIKVKVGMVNRHDYSETTLDEALRG
jgi:alpha-galactosidase/6-phospho-beta-glucosidase family protein